MGRLKSEDEFIIVGGATSSTVIKEDGYTLIDARATPRFKGEVEPLDPVAGHIPGALNRPFNLNLGADGKFKPAAELRAEFDALLAGRDFGTLGPQGYPPETVLGRAQRTLQDYRRACEIGRAHV